MKKAVAGGLGCLALCVLGFLGVGIASLSATMVRSSYDVDYAYQESPPVKAVVPLVEMPPTPSPAPLATPKPVTTPTPEAGDDDSALEGLELPTLPDPAEPTPEKKVIEISKVEAAVEDIGDDLEKTEDELDETLDAQEQILKKLGYTDEQIEALEEVYEDVQQKGGGLNLEQVQEQVQEQVRKKKARK